MVKLDNLFQFWSCEILDIGNTNDLKKVGSNLGTRPMAFLNRLGLLSDQNGAFSVWFNCSTSKSPNSTFVWLSGKEKKIRILIPGLGFTGSYKIRSLFSLLPISQRQYSEFMFHLSLLSQRANENQYRKHNFPIAGNFRERTGTPLSLSWMFHFSK